ncbi:hypothetical protein J0H58_19485 [bacterium]|nr:hypothetical protein [bacterium]
MSSRMLAEARALRAAFPDADAMGELPVSAVPVSPDATDALSDCRAALGYLRDEMLVVRAGKATDLTVLDDEMANVERLLRKV